jgi:hypothetical protein
MHHHYSTFTEMIYPRIDIVVPSLLEMQVVLTGIQIYVMKHLLFHVGYLVLVYWIPSHRYVLNGERLGSMRRTG